jgi:KDO2-lipid IV(A) lauroyltransferase
MKKFFQYLGYIFFRIGIFLINLMPLGLSQRLASTVGTLLFYLLKKRRIRAIENIRLAYGDEIDEEEVRRIALGSFQNMGKIVPELFAIPHLVDQLPDMIDISKNEKIKKVLRDGRGVVLLIFHLGCWELLAVRAPQIGLPLHSIGRPLRNPYIYEYIKSLRGITGMHNVDKDGALKASVRALRKAECVAMLCDQNAGARHPKIPFFGQEAHTFSTPVTLALQTNSEILPVECVRTGWAQYFCQVHDAIDLIREGPKEEIVRENMKRMNLVIESIIRKNPDQWLWMHNRWKIKS